MSNPCCFGFQCPYRGCSEEGDLLCTYPALAKDADEDELFGLAEETFCPLWDVEGWCDDSSVFDILDVYETTASVAIAVDEEVERRRKEADELIKKMGEVREMRGNEPREAGE